MSMITINQVAQFEELKKKSNLIVVHFMADWSPQCKQMNGVLEEMMKLDTMKDVIFTKLPAEDVTEVSLEFQITAVPTFALLYHGKLVQKLEGANAAALTTAIQAQVSKCSLTPVPPAMPKEDLKTRLKRLIESNKVMLFMKGSPNEPKCGFSRTTIQMLEKYSTEFGSFDILEDNEVRQGLKTYSDWPTYPQLYIDGEFVGGLDILKEMDSAGELEPMLIKKISLGERLKQLINKAPLMIFMKGERGQPKCGFSKQMMEILKEVGLPFETFDILTDEEVRQELKCFSNWPTYPQVYVKGELIGGLDIIKELKQDGSLIETLQG